MGIEATIEVIGGKWKPIILCNLGEKSMRSGELKKRMSEVSQKVLTEQLRELEADGIISRTSFNQVPPKVVYSLTDEGKSLRTILVEMSIWGENYIHDKQQKGESFELINKEYNGFLKM